MTWNTGKILPYTLAGFMMTGVVGLVGYDIYEAWAVEQTEPEVAESDPLDKKREEAVAVLEEVKRNDRAVAPDQVPAVIDFVIFQEIPFGQDSFEKVNVGIRYADSNTTFPAKQWCYITKSIGADDTQRNIRLAVKDNKGLALADVTPEMAKEGATTQEVIKAAQKLCRFM